MLYVVNIYHEQLQQQHQQKQQVSELRRSDPDGDVDSMGSVAAMPFPGSAVNDPPHVDPSTAFRLVKEFSRLVDEQWEVREAWRSFT